MRKVFKRAPVRAILTRKVVLRWLACKKFWQRGRQGLLKIKSEYKFKVHSQSTGDVKNLAGRCENWPIDISRAFRQVEPVIDTHRFCHRAERGIATITKVCKNFILKGSTKAVKKKTKMRFMAFLSHAEEF